MLSTGNLPLGGLPRNSVDRLTDRPDMTSAVYRVRKAFTPNKQNFQGVKCSKFLFKFISEIPRASHTESDTFHVTTGRASAQNAAKDAV